MKSHWKGSEIYRFSRSVTRNFLCRSTMVADIFEDFEPPSKKFLATPLNPGMNVQTCFICTIVMVKSSTVHSAISVWQFLQERKSKKYQSNPYICNIIRNVIGEWHYYKITNRFAYSYCLLVTTINWWSVLILRRQFNKKSGGEKIKSWNCKPLLLNLRMAKLSSTSYPIKSDEYEKIVLLELAT